ncbi:MAG: hypothetical protein HF973_19480 [Chloroflexi bacterium]|nr:hypothetical protein [Chloroflexota bacterium]
MSDEQPMGVRWQEFETADEQTRREMVRLVAERSARDLTAYEALTDMLAYHGETAVLVELARLAMPHFQTNTALTSRRKQELAAQVTDMLIFQYIESGEDDLAVLQAALEQIMPVDETQLVAFVAILRGETTYRWQLSHFVVEDMTEERQQAAAQNTAVLMLAFLGYLYQQEQIPLSKGNMMRQLWPVYLVERRTGQLEERLDMTAVMRGERPRPVIRPKPHPLCPDKVTLEQYLAKLLNYQTQPYKAAAVFTLIPSWLRFLQTCQLIDQTQQIAISAELKSMAEDLAAYWLDFSDDPALRQDVIVWK